MKKQLTILLLLFSLNIPQVGSTGVHACQDPFMFVERKKRIVKVFEVNPQDQLNIDNQFGDVKVSLWDKHEIRVDITITANAPSESKVNESLNAVSIEEKKAGQTITLKTEVAKTSGGGTWAVRHNDHSLRIDYEIRMPKRNALYVRNKFGNTEIPQFIAPLTVEAHYGSFKAQDLGSAHNHIKVAYGNADIGKMDAGKVEARYSKLELSEVKTLVLSNKFGSLNIGEVGSLNASIDYSGAKVGTLTGDGTVKLSYSNGFTINQCTAENVDIQAAYSSVVLPAEPSKFDVTVSYGSFYYPSKSPISFTSYPGKGALGKTRQYEGVIGTGNKGSNIKVVSKYGNVKLKD